MQKQVDHLERSWFLGAIKYTSSDIDCIVLKESVLNTVTLSLKFTDGRRPYEVRGKVVGYASDPYVLKDEIEAAMGQSDPPVKVVVGR